MMDIEQAIKLFGWCDSENRIVSIVLDAGEYRIKIRPAAKKGDSIASGDSVETTLDDWKEFCKIVRGRYVSGT